MESLRSLRWINEAEPRSPAGFARTFILGEFEDMRRLTCILAATSLALVFNISDARQAVGDDAVPLYERLGGRPAVEAVVDGMVKNIQADDRLAWRFKNTDFPRYKATFVDFVCMATGGPCEYKGLDMAGAHTRMGISDQEFDMTIGHVLAAMDELDVPARERAELVMLVGTLRSQVVEK